MSLYVEIEKELPSFKLKVKIIQSKGILGFLGESGSGKSMTLKCIAGLEKPTRGKIILNDRVLFDSDKNINIPTRDRNVGFLFQNYALFPHMTVSQNIELGLKNLDKEEKRKISSYYLGIVGLKGMEERFPWQLSGGQQQRVALSRVLATSPEILLLDEPFSALDHHLRSNMEKELLNLIKDYSGDIRDIELTVPEIIYRDIEYIGIREHDIVVRDFFTDSENIFSFNLVYTVENPFSFKLYFNNLKENNKSIELYNNCNVQVDIEKDNFKYEKNDTVYLEFPEDKLFCI